MSHFLSGVVREKRFVEFDLMYKEISTVGELIDLLKGFDPSSKPIFLIQDPLSDRTISYPLGTDNISVSQREKTVYIKP